jgi:hypothetical protein
MPTCWLGAMMHAMRVPSMTMIRAIDQDRQELAGVQQQMMPKVLR